MGEWPGSRGNRNQHWEYQFVCLFVVVVYRLANSSELFLVMLCWALGSVLPRETHQGVPSLTSMGLGDHMAGMSYGICTWDEKRKPTTEITTTFFFKEWQGIIYAQSPTDRASHARTLTTLLGSRESNSRGSNPSGSFCHLTSLP